MIDETMFQTVATAHNDALERGVLNIWTVYDHPKDFPQTFVARRFEVGDTSTLAPQDAIAPCVTDDIIQGELSAIRETFEMCGLTCLTRNEQDEPQIVETWL